MQTPNVWGRTRRKVGSMRIEIGKILQTSFISAQIQTLFVVNNKLLRIVKMLHKLVFQLRGIRRHYRKYAIGLVGKHDLTIQSGLYYPRFLRPKLSTPNLYEIQRNLYYPRFLRPEFSTPKYRG